MSKFDILIRCKNEMKDLPSVVQSINDQSVVPEKIVFVDSGSTDGSRQFALENGYDVRDYHTDNFNYSASLNIGMRACTSRFVVILSAHCILYNSTALETLLHTMVTLKPAGVFGRQIPTDDSTPVDVRDLLTVFGRERIIYKVRPFFHNAFSIIDSQVWNEVPFDEKVNGIEDRLWARDVCEMGYEIVYEPEAIVFHEHGLNQGVDMERAARVCKALEYLHRDDVVNFGKYLID